MVGDFGGLLEEVLGLFEARQFGVQPFEQGEHPFFAIGNLFCDLRSGVSDPVDTGLFRSGQGPVDVGGFGSRCPGGVSGRHSTPCPISADARLISGDGGWVLTCRNSYVRSNDITKGAELE